MKSISVAGTNTIPYRLPHKKWDQFERRLQKTELRLNKQMHRQLARRTIATSRWWRRQYRLSHSFRDVRRAFGYNEDILLAVCVISVFATYVGVTSGANVVYFVSQAIVATTTILGLALLPAMGIGVVACGSVLLCAAAIASCALQKATMDGLTKKYYRSFRLTVQESLGCFGRVILAWTVGLAIVITPLALFGLLGIVAQYYGRIGGEQLLACSEYGAVAGVVWLVYCSMHYACIPLVAAFQPKASVGSWIQQSHELPRRKGRIFLLSLHLMLALSAGVVYCAARVVNYLLPFGLLPTVIFGLLGVVSVYQMIMTLFYYRRRRGW